MYRLLVSKTDITISSAHINQGVSTSPADRNNIPTKPNRNKKLIKAPNKINFLGGIENLTVEAVRLTLELFDVFATGNFFPDTL